MIISSRQIWRKPFKRITIFLLQCQLIIELLYLHPLSPFFLQSALSSFYEQGDEEEAAEGRGGGSIEDLGERPQVEGAPGPPQRPPSDSAIQRSVFFPDWV